VDHVVRLQVEVDLAPDRDVDLVGRDDPRIRVANVPPPPLADHVDAQRAGFVGPEVLGRGHGDDGEHGQDHDRDGDPADPDQRVVLEP
jgi:hypothetical protein